MDYPLYDDFYIPVYHKHFSECSGFTFAEIHWWTDKHNWYWFGDDGSIWVIPPHFKDVRPKKGVTHKKDLWNDG